MYTLTRKRLRELCNALPGYTPERITELFIAGKIR